MISPGGYPGGPRGPRVGDDARGSGEDAGGGRPPTLEEMAERSRRRFHRRRSRDRRRRIFLALGLALFVAVGLGVYLGLESHRTAAEVVEEQERGTEGRDPISRETDRVLNELWKMEELERTPRGPGGRP